MCDESTGLSGKNGGSLDADPAGNDESRHDTTDRQTALFRFQMTLVVRVTRTTVGCAGGCLWTRIWCPVKVLRSWSVSSVAAHGPDRNRRHRTADELTRVEEEKGRWMFAGRGLRMKKKVQRSGGD